MRSKTAGCAILAGIALITAAILYMPRNVNVPQPTAPRLATVEPLRPARASNVPVLPIRTPPSASHRRAAAPIPVASSTRVAIEALPPVILPRAVLADAPIVSGRVIATQAVLAPVWPAPVGVSSEPVEPHRPGAIRRAGGSVAAAFSFAGRSMGGAFRKAF